MDAVGEAARDDVAVVGVGAADGDGPLGGAEDAEAVGDRVGIGGVDADQVPPDRGVDVVVDADAFR